MPSPFGNFDSTGTFSNPDGSGTGVGRAPGQFGGPRHARMRNPDGSLRQGYVNPHGQMPGNRTPPMFTHGGGGSMSRMFGRSQGGNVPMMNRNSSNSARPQAGGQGNFTPGGGPGALYGMPSASDSYARQQFLQSMNPGGQQQQGGVRSGDYLSEAFAQDYANTEQGRQQQYGAMMGLLGNAGQAGAMGMEGLQNAQQNGQQGMDVAARGAQSMADAAGTASNIHGQSRRDVRNALGEARSNMNAGINTMENAIKEQDFFRKDTVAGGVSAIQSQFAAEKQRIQSSQMDPAEKQVELDNINRMMQQQTSAYASDADSKAADSLMQAKNVLSQAQLSKGQAMGGMGLQGASITGGFGMNASQMQTQAAEAGAQLMAAQSQFQGSLNQSAMAAAIQAQLNGNMQQANIIMNAPYGATRLADTILSMHNAQGVRPGTQTSPRYGGRISGLLGNPTFTGYA